MTDIYTLRQVLIVIGLTFNCMSDGFIFGQMSGMIDALSIDKSEINMSSEDLSWIAATMNITCFLGCLLVCVTSRSLGRRISIFLYNSPVLICWVVLFFVKDKYVLLFTRAVVGMSFGGILLLTFGSVGEYVSPNLRHFYVSLMSNIGLQAGVTMGHVCSLLMGWRNVALLGIIPTGLSCLLPLFWVESPMWLATRGNFEECEKAYRALHRPRVETDIEIQNIIMFVRRKQQRIDNSSKEYVKKIMCAFTKLYFWKIQLIALIVNIFKTAAGRIFINTLAITMLKEITGENNILFHTLVLDSFGIFGVLIGCYLFKKYKLRSILFGSGIVSITILLLLSASLYFTFNEKWAQWIKVLLLACYCIILSAGLSPVFEIIATDIQPLDVKEISYSVMGFLAGVVQFLGIKVSGNIINAIDYSGFFLLNCAVILICLIYLNYFLPDISGKSLQEIDVFFKEGKFDNDVYLKSESDVPLRTHNL